MHARLPPSPRVVALLEELAGETLLLRSTRKLGLTAAGDRHSAIWRDVLAKLGKIEPPGLTGPLRGNVVLTAPELFGRLAVMPVLEAFLREQKLLTARVLLVNRVMNLDGEGVDLAVPLAPLPESTLTAIKLGTLRTLVCPTPEYLARAGHPDSPQDLSQHDCIGLNAEGDGELLPARAAVPVRSIRVRTRLSVNNAAAVIDGALRGNGLIHARAYQVAEAIAAGRLVQVLKPFEPSPEPVHLLFHPDNGRRGPVRALINAIVPALRTELHRIASIAR